MSECRPIATNQEHELADSQVGVHFPSRSVYYFEGAQQQRNFTGMNTTACRLLRYTATIMALGVFALWQVAQAYEDTVVKQKISQMLFKVLKTAL